MVGVKRNECESHQRQLAFSRVFLSFRFLFSCLYFIKTSVHMWSRAKQKIQREREKSEQSCNGGFSLSQQSALGTYFYFWFTFMGRSRRLRWSRNRSLTVYYLPLVHLQTKQQQVSRLLLQIESYNCPCSFQGDSGDSGRPISTEFQPNSTRPDPWDTPKPSCR